MRHLLTFLLMFASLPATSAESLRVCGFGGSSNWPVFVAVESADIAFTAVRDSASQLADLLSGKCEVALTAMDNVVAVDQRGSDVVALAGVTGGARLQLFAQRDKTDLRALRGAKLAVDAIDTGYSFVLEEFLRQAGLGRDDYQLVSVGGSRQRWDALRKGEATATLLNAPYDAMARADGFPRLATSESLGPYQGSVVAARREWLKANEDRMAAFLRAYKSAIGWLYEAANKEKAIAVLRKHQQSLKADEANASYDDLVATKSFDARLDADGIRKVLELRSRFARPAPKLKEPAAYYDAR